MPERKSKKIEEQKPTNSLRRSSSLHRESQTGAQRPRTPKAAEARRGRPDSFSTPISKIKKIGLGVLEHEEGKDTESNLEKPRNGLRRSARLECRGNFSSSSDLGKRSVKEKRQTRSSVSGRRSVKGSARSGEGSRRPGKRDGGDNVDRCKKNVYLRKEEVIEKRVTRSSIRINEVVYVGDSDSEVDYRCKKVLYPRKEDVIEKRVTRSSNRRNEVVYVGDSDSGEDSGERVVIVSKERKSRVDVGHIEKNGGKTKKRVTRSSRNTDKKKASNAPNTRRRKAVVSDEVEPQGDDELSKKDSGKKDVEDCGIMKRNGEQNCKRKVQVGEKRKRDGVEEECKAGQGWSNEQELFLQRAYFTAKPTPQFWKKVARMVPGKSAEECFDKIHSDHLTPPQPRTRSRAKIKEPSPLSFSASKLLSPAEKKSKKLGWRRRALVAQKTVRHILQKQQKEDQDYNADLFAVLEKPMMNPSPVILEEGTTFASPAPSKASPFLTACRLVSSSSQRKHLSRLNSSQEAAFTSPPVLKQIKNMALHEKYIDQLHCRDAKRKAEALRNSRNIKEQIDEKVNHVKQDLVKAAKDALVSDARDAISKFRSLQCRIDDDDDDDDSNSCSDYDDDGL